MTAAYRPGPDAGVTVSDDGQCVYVAHLPDGRPDAGHGSAHVDRAEFLAGGCEKLVDVVLDGQVGLGDRRAADLRRERGRPLLAAVIVRRAPSHLRLRRAVRRRRRFRRTHR